MIIIMTEDHEKSCGCDIPDCCSLKGKFHMLRFLIMWILSKEPMYGSQIADEIGRRRGDRPTAGTIYPALKDLTENDIIESRTEGKQKIYSLTDKGKEALTQCHDWFVNAFGDIIKDKI